MTYENYVREAFNEFLRANLDLTKEQIEVAERAFQAACRITVSERERIFDEGYDIGYDDGYGEGYVDGQQDT